MARRDQRRKLIIATTRPEMLHACVAVAVNPNDENYKDSYRKGSQLRPIFDKTVK
jgi:valyl-tRNA synthetase